MEIRHLRYFIAVAELRNFTRAAQACFVAQSALSQQIGRLEREVGAPLFTRGKRGAALTPAGQVLLPHARRLVTDEAWARAEMRSYLGLEKGRLTIGLIQTSASGVDLAQAVGAFYRGHPGIELRVVNQTSAQMIDGVRAGALDLAVVGVGPDELPDGLDSRLLAVDPLVGVAAGSLADGLTGPAGVAELAARGPLIQFAPGTGLRRHVDAALVRAGVTAAAGIELAQAADMLEFAALGLGVTIVPRTLAVGAARPPAAAAAGPAGPPGEPPAGPARPYTVLGLTDPLAVHPVTLVFDAPRLSVAAREFIDLLSHWANVA
jgi:DNA-binding transcriptional LysR family regulator